MTQHKLKCVSKTVTTAGTRVALSSSDLFVPWFRVEGLVGNTGNCFVGGDDVASSLYSALLEKGKGITYCAPTENNQGASPQLVFNLKNIYIDAATNGDKVLLSYPERS